VKNLEEKNYVRITICEENDENDVETSNFIPNISGAFLTKIVSSSLTSAIITVKREGNN
jgi:hypothetical protein